jgi:hypothetical protein
MAKRGGKAASRKSRQRPVRRPAPPARPAPTAPAAGQAGGAGSPAASAALPAPSTGDRRATRALESGAPARPPAPDPGAVYGSSVLSQRARAEYHYVARDLRNIGVLTAVIALLLALAFVLFRVVGLGP